LARCLAGLYPLICSRRDSGPESAISHPSKLGPRFPFALSTQASTVAQAPCKARGRRAADAARRSSLAQDSLRAANPCPSDTLGSTRKNPGIARAHELHRPPPSLWSFRRGFYVRGKLDAETANLKTWILSVKWWPCPLPDRSPGTRSCRRYRAKMTQSRPPWLARSKLRDPTN